MTCSHRVELLSGERVIGLAHNLYWCGHDGRSLQMGLGVLYRSELSGVTPVSGDARPPRIAVGIVRPGEPREMVGTFTWESGDIEITKHNIVLQHATWRLEDGDERG